MRHSLALLLAVACVATACDPARTGATAKRPTTAATTATPAGVPTAATSQVAASPSPAPVGGSSPAPAGPASFVQLAKPAGEYQTLAGTIALDSSYIVAQGAGNLVAQGAGNVVVAGNGIVAQGAGNLVAQGAGNLVASGAGNFVSQNGSAIVASGAGNLVAQGAGNFGLLAAKPVAYTGEVVLANGMDLGVIDLATGEPVPLGVDDKGQPVFTVFSNQVGHYELYLPKAIDHNVMVVARVPGNSDPRLAYDFVTTPDASKAGLDEDSSLITRFVRRSYTQTMEILVNGLVNTKPGDEQAANDRLLKELLRGAPAADPETGLSVMRTLLGPKLDRIRAGLKARNVQPADLTAEAQRFADYVLAGIPLGEEEVPVEEFDPADIPADRKIMEVLVETLGQTRTAVGKYIADTHDEGPTYLENVAILQPYKLDIRKASDLVEFIVVRYLADPDCMGRSGGSFEQRVAILKACGMAEPVARKALRRTSAATSTLANKVVNQLINPEDLDGDGEADRIQGLIKLAETPLKRGNGLFPTDSPPPAPVATPDISCTAPVEPDQSATP